jgi:hypothetical protein
MKHFVRLHIMFVFLACAGQAGEPDSFGKHFIDSTLRIDYFHVGSAAQEFITVDHLYRQGAWAGPTRDLIDPFPDGRYGIRVLDAATGTLLYTKKYDTYFGEYKTTEPGKQGVRRTYHESVLLPFPRQRVRVEFEKRDRTNTFHLLDSLTVDPADYHIVREPAGRGDSLYVVTDNGDPHERVDILVLGDGYTRQEQKKFESDLARYCRIFFSWEPYRSRASRFNFRGIFAASPESGTDEPRQGIYRKTVLGATFNSLDSDRYLLVEDNKTMRDVAAQAPYDAIMVMVNSKRYGGGGIYNLYSTFTSDGTWNEHVMHHEFGHAFAGLGDEYYTRDVAYDEFLPPGIEPTEANITAFPDSAKLKWRDLVSPGLTLPTEWGQARFDSLGSARDSLLGLRRRNAAEWAARGESRESIQKKTAVIDSSLASVGRSLFRFFMDHPLRGKVGAFEGGGYVPKGFYRPTVNSLMNAFNEEERTFYPVNERAITKVIDFYSR